MASINPWSRIDEKATFQGICQEIEAFGLDYCLGAPLIAWEDGGRKVESGWKFQTTPHPKTRRMGMI